MGYHLANIKLYTFAPTISGLKYFTWSSLITVTVIIFVGNTDQTPNSNTTHSKSTYQKQLYDVSKTRLNHNIIKIYKNVVLSR